MVLDDAPLLPLPTCSACTMDLSLALRGTRLKRPPMRLRPGRRSWGSRLRFSDETLEHAVDPKLVLDNSRRRTTLVARPEWPKTAPTIPNMMYKTSNANVSRDKHKIKAKV